MDWFWQGIVSNMFWVALTVIIGIIWGWLRHKNVSWLPVLAYGLAGCAFTAVIIYTMIGRSLLSTQQPQTTPENVEANLRAWSDDARLGVTRAPTAQGMYFALAVTLQNGNKIIVGRANERPNDIQVQSALVLAPEQQAALAKLTKEQADDVTAEITL